MVQSIQKILNRYELSNIQLVDNSKINSYPTQIILSMIGLYIDNIITTSINGFNIFVLSRKESKIPFPKSWYKLSFSENINIESKKEPLYIQLQPNAFVLGFTDKLYNMKHEFIHTYLITENIKDVYLKGNITKIFDEFKQKIDESERFCFSYYKNNKEREKMKKIYLEELNVIAQKMWKFYQEHKIVSLTSKYKEITEDDFPFGLNFSFTSYE